MTDIEKIEADLKSIDDARRCMESMKSIYKDPELTRDLQMIWSDLRYLADRLQRKLGKLKNEGGAM